jgi:hypothetical protein
MIKEHNLFSIGENEVDAYLKKSATVGNIIEVMSSCEPYVVFHYLKTWHGVEGYSNEKSDFYAEATIESKAAIKWFIENIDLFIKKISVTNDDLQSGGFGDPDVMAIARWAILNVPIERISAALPSRLRKKFLAEI